MRIAHEMLANLRVKLPFVTGKKFYAIFSTLVAIQPIAIWLQTYQAWTSTTTEGISGMTFLVFLILQVVTVLYAIREQLLPIFVVMILSSFGSIGIILAVCVR